LRFPMGTPSRNRITDNATAHQSDIEQFSCIQYLEYHDTNHHSVACPLLRPACLTVASARVGSHRSRCCSLHVGVGDASWSSHGSETLPSSRYLEVGTVALGNEGRHELDEGSSNLVAGVGSVAPTPTRDSFQFPASVSAAEMPPLLLL
jgi:hypothetical protein